MRAAILKRQKAKKNAAASAAKKAQMAKWVDRQAAKEAKKDEEKAALERVRKRAEAGLTDKGKCIQAMKDRYGDDTTRDIMQFICKLFKKIVSKPSEPKCRRLDKSKHMVRQMILIPVGPRVFLELHGWKTGDKFLEFGSRDPTSLAESVKKLEELFPQPTSQVSDFSEELKKAGVSVEDQYFAAARLRGLLRNLVVGQTESTRRIEVENVEFKARVGRHKPAIKLLKSLGFEVKGEKRKKVPTATLR
eukprot:TRINITY_DN720_c0_g1_i1.p2 TRINITY_DN720_c0_g1~~TRINITY_DN720_c0_g1_i1.p2  ORF type:complete len:248 (-),score=66.35 TRINITY_DN720_c0_g1_i1:14-757(-)